MTINSQYIAEHLKNKISSSKQSYDTKRSFFMWWEKEILDVTEIRQS